MTDVNSDLFAWEPFNYDSRMVKNIFMDKIFSVERRMVNYSYSITILNGEFKGQNILDLGFLLSRGITKEFLKNLYGGKPIELLDVGKAGLLSRISFSQLVKLVNALNLSDKLFFLDNSCSLLQGKPAPFYDHHNSNLPFKTFFQSDNNLKDLLVTDEQVTVVNLDPTVEDYSTMSMLARHPTIFESAENHRIFNTQYCNEEVEGGKRKSKKLRSKKLRSKKLRSKKLRSKKH